MKDGLAMLFTPTGRPVMGVRSGRDDHNIWSNMGEKETITNTRTIYISMN